MASNKSDRSMSPSTLSEEGRRELIARQHRALYGAEISGGFSPHGQYSQEGGEQGSQGQGVSPQNMRGASPRGMDPFGMHGQQENQQQTSEGKTNSPPSHQHGMPPSPSTGDESGHARSISKSTTAPVSGSMGPIGSRPNNQHMPGQSLGKRTTSPLPPSMGFGSFNVPDQNNERNVSSQGNVGQKESSNPALGAWGTGSGVWGNKIGASVWG